MDSTNHNNNQDDGGHARQEEVFEAADGSSTPSPMTRPRVVIVSGKQYTYHELVCPVPQRGGGGAGGGGGSGGSRSSSSSDAHTSEEGEEGEESTVQRQHVFIQMQEALAADEHLLLQILTHLTPAELSVARQVSRIWNKLADSNTIWRPICIRKWPSWQNQPMKVRISICFAETTSCVCILLLFHPYCVCCPASLRFCLILSSVSHPGCSLNIIHPHATFSRTSCPSPAITTRIPLPSSSSSPYHLPSTHSPKCSTKPSLFLHPILADNDHGNGRLCCTVQKDGTTATFKA